MGDNKPITETTEFQAALAEASANLRAEIRAEIATEFQAKAEKDAKAADNGRAERDAALLQDFDSRYKNQVLTPAEQCLADFYDGHLNYFSHPNVKAKVKDRKTYIFTRSQKPPAKPKKGA